MAFEVGAGKGKKGRAAPSMNVTPLVDVVLVLLIIFLVITPMMAKQFWLVLPQKPDKQPETQVKEPDDKDKSIVVSLDGAGEIRINHDVISKEAFSERLHRVLAGTGERTIFFDAADSARFGNAMEVMDHARNGGAQHIVVLTEPLAIR
jgi:biopolymer transport protein ExbD/biopolymer transport protein TolR